MGNRSSNNKYIVANGVPLQVNQTPIGTEYISQRPNGEIKRFYNLQEAVNSYKEAQNSGQFKDPSENILNDLMVFGPQVGKALSVAGNIAKGISTATWNTGKKLVTGQITKEAAKQGVKTATKTVLKEVPKIGTSIAVGKGVDAATQAYTGKTWGQNVSDELTQHWGFKVPEIVGDFTNPGNYIGYNYGNFVVNNYSNLGRYSLDNLYPSTYGLTDDFFPAKAGNHLEQLWRVYTQPLYKKPPTFFNGKMPHWMGDEFPPGQYELARFENSANWAGIPEEEIPRKFFTRNPDGTYSPTEIVQSRRVMNPSKLKFTKAGQLRIAEDNITPGVVGGGHSNYTYLGQDAVGNKYIKFEDKQILNPQWKLTHPIKLEYRADSWMYNFLDRLGGKPLNWMLGYKPFTIKAGLKYSPGETQIPELINLDDIPYSELK